MEKPCFFCDVKNNSDFIVETNLFFARYDDFPVSKGHFEIIPKRHIPDFDSLNNDELLDFHKILIQSKKIISKKFNPDGFNLGINEGVIAGQSIMHLHIHIIPRYSGDVKNPKGGVRNILSRGDYTIEVPDNKKKYL